MKSSPWTRLLANGPGFVNPELLRRDDRPAENRILRAHDRGTLLQQQVGSTFSATGLDTTGVSGVIQYTLTSTNK